MLWVEVTGIRVLMAAFMKWSGMVRRVAGVPCCPCCLCREDRGKVFLKNLWDKCGETEHRCGVQ